MQKAQASMEYILILGALLVVIIPLFYYVATNSSQNVKISQSEDVVTSLAKAADEVYVLSPGTKTYVWVTVPGGVQSTQVIGTELSLTVSFLGNTSDIVAITHAPVTGEIPTQRGTYRIPVEHLESGIVLIGLGNDTTTPTITWVSPSGSTCNPITLRATTDEAAQCKFDTTDISFDTMTFTMEGTSLGHSYSYGVQAEGSYSYFLRCRDAFSNEINSSTNMNYDLNFTSCGVASGQTSNESDPPNVTLINPASGYITNSSKVDFFYNVTDASSILLCRLIVNESATTSALLPQKNLTNNLTANLNLGIYTWYVSCNDASGTEGNSSARTVQVNATLDVDLPVVKLTSPTNATTRNFNYIQFFYNVSDATSAIYSCTISIMSVLSSGGTSGQAVTDFSITENTQESLALVLDKGNHTWNVSCLDNSIYQNKGISQNWLVKVNSTSGDSFITSCAGLCGFNGYSNGVCRQEPTKCTQNNEIYTLVGDQYCTGGSQSDTCCCVP